MVVQGARGTPNGHLEVQLSIFVVFRVHFGVSWDPLWTQFCDLSVIWGTKVGGSFQVHLFDDPGMEMMPECSGCMCLNHCKNCGFREIPRFPLIHEFDVPRMVLGVISVTFGDLGHTFSDI